MPRTLAMEPAATLISSGPDDTHRIGVSLGRCLEPGHVVGLVGELGAGKTALAAGVAEGMDVPDSVYVSSPSFTLVNEYPGRFPLVHVDLYRLQDPRDLVEIGLDEYYRQPVACLVEWFDRFGEAAPPAHLRVNLEVEGSAQRRLELHPVGAVHQRLARDWARAVSA